MLPSPSPGPPLLSASASRPLFWAMPLDGAAAFGVVWVGGAAVAAGAVVAAGGDDAAGELEDGAAGVAPPPPQAARASVTSGTAAPPAKKVTTLCRVMYVLLFGSFGGPVKGDRDNDGGDFGLPHTCV